MTFKRRKGTLIGGSSKYPETAIRACCSHLPSIPLNVLGFGLLPSADLVRGQSVSHSIPGPFLIVMAIVLADLIVSSKPGGVSPAVELELTHLVGIPVW